LWVELGFALSEMVVWGFGGVGGCMLYEGWFEVEICGCCGGFGERKWELELIEGASRCTREQVLCDEHMKDTPDR
jgi:hypothetical protein